MNGGKEGCCHVCGVVGHHHDAWNVDHGGGCGDDDHHDIFENHGLSTCDVYLHLENGHGYAYVCRHAFYVSQDSAPSLSRHHLSFCCGSLVYYSRFLA